MQNKIKFSLLGFAFIASIVAAALPASARDVVFIEGGGYPGAYPGYYGYNYGYGGYGPYGAYSPYYVGGRPFSLHRFVGNAVGGALGLGGGLLFNPLGYWW